MSAAFLHQLRREEHVVLEQAEAMITLCSEQGFAYNLAMGPLLRGWALTEQGQGEEGIAQMRQGQAALRAMGARIGHSADFARLADVYGKVGRAEDGLKLLAEALAGVQETVERFWQAELYRLKGELLLKTETRSREGEAENCFQQAIAIACNQSAKSWQLRATTSLARLWQHQGKRKEAHKLLSDIHDWFTEGFDTKDLREAKALLEELG